MKFLQKTVPVLYIIMMSIILILLYFASFMDYRLKRDFLIPNIFVLLLVVPIVFILFKYCKSKTKYGKVKVKEELSDKKYYLIMLIISILTFALQIFITKKIYFKTDWDVKVVNDILKTFLTNGNIKDDFYLSIYPNNIFLLFILAAIKRLPLVGKYYFTRLFVNVLCVNLSGVFTYLTIKNTVSKKASLLSSIVVVPLIMLSPWIVIPYTDTFAIPFVIFQLYIYSKKELKFYDYLLLGLTAMIGYRIKPTVLIIFMAMTIVEVLVNFKDLFKLSFYKKNAKNFSCLMVGFIIATLIFKAGSMYLHFTPMENVKPFTFIHYLAMGQNNKTLGAYSQNDINNSTKYGKVYDLKKFYRRLSNRSLGGQISFFSKKTLLNYNDGSFSWGQEGRFFYKKTKDKSASAKFLRSIYYGDGKNYQLFLTIQNIIWVLVISFCPFIVKKKDNKKIEFVLMLSIIGMTLFLTLFEPRTRYLYCYSEVYVVIAFLGIANLMELFSKKTRKKVRAKKVK